MTGSSRGYISGHTFSFFHIAAHFGLLYAVFRLYLLAHHRVNFFNWNSSHAAQTTYYLLVLHQENFGEDKLIWSNAHFFNSHDIRDNLLDNMVVIGPDLVELVSFSHHISLWTLLRLIVELAEIFFPVCEVLRGEDKFVLAPMR